MSKKFNNILNRSRNIKNSDLSTIIEGNTDISLRVDTSALELNCEELIEIKEISKEIRFYKDEVNKSLHRLSESIYKAYSIFSNKKIGTFEKYIESEGLEKSFAYRLLRRYKLYLEFKNEVVFDVGVRTIDYICKTKENLTEEEIMKILTSENPSLEIKMLDNKNRVEKEEIINYEDINYIYDLKEKINFLNPKEKKKYIKEEEKHLKNHLKELQEKIKNEKMKLKKLKEIKSDI